MSKIKNMSKWCNNRDRKLIYIITKLTCRRFRSSYILPNIPPPPEIALNGAAGLTSPTGKAPGEMGGETQAEPRGESGRYVTVSCRTSVCVSTLPPAVLLSLPSCRPAGFRRPSVIGRGARLSAPSPASIIPPAAGLAAGGSTRRPPRLSTKVS